MAASLAEPKPMSADTIAGAASRTPLSDVQMRSTSCPQPVPRRQSVSASSTVHSLAPTLAQNPAASSYVLECRQAVCTVLKSLLSVQGHVFERRDQPGIASSEQHRTSCCSECAAHAADSEQRSFPPHEVKWHTTGLGVGLVVVDRSVVTVATVVTAVVAAFIGGVISSAHVWQARAHSACM